MVDDVGERLSRVKKQVEKGNAGYKSSASVHRGRGISAIGVCG